MDDPVPRPPIPGHWRRSRFGGYIRKDNMPSKMKMDIGKPQSDGSVVVTMTPQGAITGHEFDEFVKARGGTTYRLDTGGDGIFDPFQEDGKNSKSTSKQ